VVILVTGREKQSLQAFPATTPTDKPKDFKMESLLTATIVAITILFIASAIADFTAGLIKLWKSAGSQTQP
jgi:hypothetical protein